MKLTAHSVSDTQIIMFHIFLETLYQVEPVSDNTTDNTLSLLYTHIPVIQLFHKTKQGFHNLQNLISLSKTT